MVFEAVGKSRRDEKEIFNTVGNSDEARMDVLKLAGIEN